MSDDLTQEKVTAVAEAQDARHFWKIRSAKYDKLFWTKDASYLDAIVQCAELNEADLVLDVGCGTGAVAKRIEPHVRHVVGMDISGDMLQQGRWDGVSVVKWDISEQIFCSKLFDKITARMVFHHILDHIDRAFIRCFDLLKHDGMLVIAEGIPPSDDPDVVDWYTEMFRHKEERRTFHSGELADFMRRNGFTDIRQHEYIMRDFSVKNWLENAGLPPEQQKLIMDMHRNAPARIKDLYEMRLLDGDCLISTRNLIVTGRRP